MKKKVFIISAAVVGFLLLFLFTAPFIFRGKIESMVLETINKKLTAEVAYDKVDLSLFTNFPKASISISKLSIVNQAPFAGDTLLFAEHIHLKMSMMELFNGADKPMNIEGVDVQNAAINVLINEAGVANYDIAIKDEEDEQDPSNDSPFSLNLNQYALNNIKLVYHDLSSKMKMVVSELNHSGSGNLAQNILDLDTQSQAKVSFEKDGTALLNNVNLGLKAVIGMDLEKNLYTFKENEATINQLPLKFNGTIQLLAEGQEYHLDFATPDSSFKNFLALIPEAYAGDIQKVKTEGEFRVSGKVNGKLTETAFPKMEIVMASDKASFQYPDLPKAIRNIALDAKIINDTGLINDTYVLLNKLNFQIDQDVFKAEASIKNIMDNALVNAKLNGIVNLANLSKAYPIKLEKPLTGILKADVVTQFDMKSVETNQYQNIKNTGSISLTNFNYESEEMAKPLQIKEAALVFNPNQVRLNRLELKTGTTDLLATGTLDNFYGFLFSKQNLKGNFALNSNNFVVSDILKASDTPTDKTETEAKKMATAKKEPLKIPSFLDCTITANAKTVVYDDLTLKNVVGKLIIKDEAVHFQNMKTDVFDGQIAFNGNVSTKTAVPTFDMNLGLQALDIAKSFSQIDMLKRIAPIAGVINGKINSNIKLNGKLDGLELTPIMSSLTGDLLGQLLSTKIDANNSKLLTALDSNLKFVDLNKLNLDNLKMHLELKDGKVKVNPFDLKYQDIKVVVGGEHGLDQTINYKLNFDVPAKYLGDDISGVLSKLSATDMAALKNIPIQVGLTGDFSKPKVTTDLNQAVTNLSNQIIATQKDKLINQGSNALSNLLGGGKKDSNTDTKTPEETQKEAKKEETINKIGEGLKDLFGKKKKE
ncbi:AsmA-like C-terminal region-containing protein [Flavobacterium sp. NKUCC04_CG]|uniref:AsmA-like C-terminal region-containing protein n=1 Tax=Flavobacterium sp. NKUCC04_CG TaxID=2842121 RepID=UPI001C5B6145|nr:AsmA-like C-terminal region-containing protein [Flavobacterium sp. NKUCC04_CG]MBW3518182.1 AsmA-like C-terminal region-containing protein [Flavobacterium sp. NKUCC04_CG]